MQWRLPQGSMVVLSPFPAGRNKSQAIQQFVSLKALHDADDETPLPRAACRPPSPPPPLAAGPRRHSPATPGASVAARHSRRPCWPRTPPSMSCCAAVSAAPNRPPPSPTQIGLFVCAYPISIRLSPLDPPPICIDRLRTLPTQIRLSPFCASSSPLPPPFHCNHHLCLLPLCHPRRPPPPPRPPPARLMPLEPPMMKMWRPRKGILTGRGRMSGAMVRRTSAGRKRGKWEARRRGFLKGRGSLSTAGWRRRSSPRGSSGSTSSTCCSGPRAAGTMNTLLLDLFYHEIVLRGFTTDVVTFSIRIDAYCKKGRMHDALQLLEEMEKRNCAPTLETMTTLVHGGSIARNPFLAHRLFDKIMHIQFCG